MNRSSEEANQLGAAREGRHGQIKTYLFIMAGCVHAIPQTPIGHCSVLEFPGLVGGTLGWLVGIDGVNKPDFPTPTHTHTHQVASLLSSRFLFHTHHRTTSQTSSAQPSRAHIWEATVSYTPPYPPDPSQSPPSERKREPRHSPSWGPSSPPNRPQPQQPWVVAVTP